MLSKNLTTLFVLIMGFSSLTAQAADATAKVDDKFSHPLYFGFGGGYGSTTWDGLIPPQSKMSTAMALSTPNHVSEGGGIWNVMAGYELIPAFAIEAAYTHYPTATIYFSKKSLFSFQNHGRQSFTTNTESVSLSGKFMVIIPRTTLRVYSSAGVAGVRRYDKLKDCWTANPSFGVGLNYNFTPHIMGEMGANYTGGYGVSELTPSNDYIPFLYSVFFRVAYRI